MDKEFQKKPNRWKPEEIAILKQYYPLEGRAVYARLPGRSKEQCGEKAYKLGIRVIQRHTNAWTLEEDEILKKYYPYEGFSAARHLPNRTEKACVRRACQLNIHSLKGKSNEYIGRAIRILPSRYSK